MGIFDKLKGELIDIIEWTDNTSDTLVYKYDRPQNEIKNGAQLIVRESQHATFVREGSIADNFKPGTYTLDTKNIPIMSTLLGWKHGFESPFKAEVYFVSTRVFTGMGWGTASPIPLRDPEFSMVRIRAHGTYNFQVSDPVKLVTGLAGTNSRYQVENIEQQLRTLLVSQFSDALGELKIPVLDLAAQYNELGEKIEGIVNRKFDELGLRISQFVIANITLPPEVEAALDKRTAMGMAGNLNDYAKFQAANAMENMAKNPGGDSGMMGAGMGAGMGVAMAQQFAGMMGGGAQQQAASPPPIPGQAPFMVAINGQQQGPFAPSQLQSMIQSGQLTPDTLVWKQGMANWTKASDVPDIQSLFGAVPPPLPLA